MEIGKTGNATRDKTYKGGLPLDVLKYAAQHYPGESLTTELFRKAEAELKAQRAEEKRNG